MVLVISGLMPVYLMLRLLSAADVIGIQHIEQFLRCQNCQKQSASAQPFRSVDAHCVWLSHKLSAPNPSTLPSCVRGFFDYKKQRCHGNSGRALKCKKQAGFRSLRCPLAWLTAGGPRAAAPQLLVLELPPSSAHVALQLQPARLHSQCKKKSEIMSFFCLCSHNERKVTCKHPVSGIPSQDNCIFVVNEQ